MDRETYEKKQPFAGKKQPSMKRRGVGHDYTRPGVYMLTLVVEGRRPLLATVSGTSSEPRVTLTALGKCVHDEWLGISKYYPQVKSLGLQLMPDHMHGILQVKEQLPCHLSNVVRGFKTGCGRAYRRLFPTSAAIQSQQTGGGSQNTNGSNKDGKNSGGSSNNGGGSQNTNGSNKDGNNSGGGGSNNGGSSSNGGGSRSHPKHGMLFEPGFNDRFLKEKGQLEVWQHYLWENPKRLLMKREHPDLFRVQRNVMVGGQSFSAIGNRFLLERPERVAVQCSRRLTAAEIAQQVEHFVALGCQGAVLVSPAISPGEKAVMRAAFDAGLPLILLQENGFTDLAKPGGQRMTACAEGRLLIMAPWDHHHEQQTIRRNQCLELNALAQMICNTEM